MPTTYTIETQRSVVALDLSPAQSGIFTSGIESLVFADHQLDRFNALARLLEPDLPALSADQIAGVARRVLRTAAAGGQSPFIGSRLRRANEIRAMAADPAWPLDPARAQRIDALLAYLDDPNDLIRDDLPVVGRLDDAMLVDIAMDGLREELDDYAEFCRYRAAEVVDGDGSDIDRARWEQARIDEMRLEQQLRRVRAGHYGGSTIERLFRVC